MLMINLTFCFLNWISQYRCVAVLFFKRSLWRASFFLFFLFLPFFPLRTWCCCLHTLYIQYKLLPTDKEIDPIHTTHFTSKFKVAAEAVLFLRCVIHPYKREKKKISHTVYIQCKIAGCGSRIDTSFKMWTTGMKIKYRLTFFVHMNCLIWWERWKCKQWCQCYLINKQTFDICLLFVNVQYGSDLV